MSDNLILNPSTLSISISKIPLTCFPETGPILTTTRLTDDAAWTGGINGCGALVVLGGNGLSFSVNLLAFSNDHSRMNVVRELFKNTGQPVTVVGSYGTSQWVSPGAAIQNIGAVNINADGAEFVPVLFVGPFPTATIGVWVAPPVLTPEQITG